VIIDRKEGIAGQLMEKKNCPELYPFFGAINELIKSIK
jgi:hypothetical protein